jgi:hypothetical protein
MGCQSSTPNITSATNKNSNPAKELVSTTKTSKANSQEATGIGRADSQMSMEEEDANEYGESSVLSDSEYSLYEQRSFYENDDNSDKFI